MVGAVRERATRRLVADIEKCIFVVSFFLWPLKEVEIVYPVDECMYNKEWRTEKVCTVSVDLR